MFCFDVFFYLFFVKMAPALITGNIKNQSHSRCLPVVTSLLLDVIRDVLRLGYVFACSSLVPPQSPSCLPTSELFDPPTQLSHCSYGSLSTSLQCGHQRAPCLISYICHTFTNKERQQGVATHSFVRASETQGWKEPNSAQTCTR